MICLHYRGFSDHTVEMEEESEQHRGAPGRPRVTRMDRHTDNYEGAPPSPTPSYEDDELPFTERDPEIAMECASTERVPRFKVVAPERPPGARVV